MQTISFARPGLFSSPRPDRLRETYPRAPLVRQPSSDPCRNRTCSAHSFRSPDRPARCPGNWPAVGPRVPTAGVHTVRPANCKPRPLSCGRSGTRPSSVTRCRSLSSATHPSSTRKWAVDRQAAEQALPCPHKVSSSRHRRSATQVGRSAQHVESSPSVTLLEGPWLSFRTPVARFAASTHRRHSCPVECQSSR